MRLFTKGIKLSLGHITELKNGRRMQKVAPNKWKYLAGPDQGRLDKDFYDKKAQGHLDSAYKLFMESTGEMSWAGIGIVEHLEEKYGIYDFEDLKNAVANKPRDKASEIYRSTKQYIDSLTIATGMKKAAVDRIGRTLLALRDAYSAPKEKLLIQVPKTGGGKRYKPKSVASPAFAATAVKSAKKKLGGWTDMKAMPDASQVRGLLKTGAAKKVSGRVNPKKKWQLKQKLESVTVPYAKSGTGVSFSMRQSEKVKQRTKTTAEIALTIPFAYARQFIKNHIKSVRTQNFIIGRMENSKGYQKALGMRDPKPKAQTIEPRDLAGPSGRVG